MKSLLKKSTTFTSLALAGTLLLAACGGNPVAQDTTTQSTTGAATADTDSSEAADTSEATETEESETADDKLAEIKARGVLYVGTSPDFPPSEFYILDENNQKQIVGSDISLAQAIADEIGVELEIKATDFSSVLANIQAGQIDMGISGFAATEARKQVMQFSDGYQRETDDGYQGILTTQDIADQYATLEELIEAELTFGVQGASIQFETASKLTSPANIKQLGTMDALALALNAGDIDAVTVSTDSAEPLLETFTGFVILPKDGFNLDPDGMYSTNVIGFPLGDEYASLIEVANKVIAEARASGQLEEWVEEAKALRERAVD